MKLKLSKKQNERLQGYFDEIRGQRDIISDLALKRQFLNAQIMNIFVEAGGKNKKFITCFKDNEKIDYVEEVEQT